MKNKKSIAMAMAAVSTFGAVAPAFANEVKTDINVRLSSGKVLKVKEDGKEVYTRTEIYNTNGTKDRSDDTLKTAFKNVEIVLSKENEKDSYLDEFVLAEKATNIADVNDAEAKIKTAKTIIAEAKEKGAKVVVKNEAAKIVNGEFKDSRVTVEITNKGSQKVDTRYVFVGAEGIVDDKEEKPVTAASLFDEIFSGYFLANTTLDLNSENYFNVNLMKALIEGNIEKFDIVKDESGVLNADLDVTLYVKGSKKTNNDKVITVTFKNVAKLNKDLLVNLPDIENSDFSNHWAKEQIVEAMFKSYVDASSTFRPGDSITRAEFVKIVNRVFNVELPVGMPKIIMFADVDNNQWYGRDIYAAMEEGYINGYETSKVITDANGQTVTETVREFRPNQPITRQEAAKIIARMVKGEEVETDADIKTDFADDKEIANWADESVKYLKDNNISNGYVENGQTVFKPQANITRAEALVMLLRSVK